MRVLGIDPGLATTGIGLIETSQRGQCVALDWFVITTPAGLPIPERLLEIATDLHECIAEHRPSLVVVEKLFFATNKKTALDVAQARGVILMTVQRSCVPLLEVTPLQLKSGITGDGRADKTQLQDMLVKALKLTERPKPDDAADALALALYGATANML